MLVDHRCFKSAGLDSNGNGLIDRSQQAAHFDKRLAGNQSSEHPPSEGTQIDGLAHLGHR